MQKRAIYPLLDVLYNSQGMFVNVIHQQKYLHWVFKDGKMLVYYINHDDIGLKSLPSFGSPSSRIDSWMRNRLQESFGTYGELNFLTKRTIC